MEKKYDVVVIGAGSGGLTSAVGLAKVGKKVLLIERDRLGGECTNSGCIPSKALLHHAKSYHAAISISGNNGHTENYRREAFNYARTKINETLEHETPEHFSKLGITVVKGEARFTSPTTLIVHEDTITFKKAIIATGSSPRVIDIPGLDPSRILTNQNLFTLESIPARTLIVGAGPIGLEMGQALALLGSTVTILDNGSVFAQKEDVAIQPIIKKAFISNGITILQQASIHHVDGSTAYVTHSDMDIEVEIAFDKVLLAIGRTPNVPLGVETAHIKTLASGITVNAAYQTSNKRVYALGDVADTMKFTHMADAAARGVVARIATKGWLRFTPSAIPKVTYTQPELAQVGFSQTQVEEQYSERDFYRIEVPYIQNDRARTDDAEQGVVVVFVKRLSGKILGVHIAGERAGELIALFTLAMDQKLSLWKLRRTIYAYPTYALLVKKVGDVFFATQIKNLRSDVQTLAGKILPKLIIIIIWGSALYYLWQLKVVSGQDWNQLSLTLFTFITGTMWGPLLYIALYTVRPVLFFPASALTILSGIFFGLWGFVYTMIGANLSAMVAHAIGRYFSVSPKSLPALIRNISGPLRTHPFMTILTMHLTFMPFDAVNYAAGIFRAPFLKHSFATFLGTILGSFTFVSIGASLDVEEFMEKGITVDAINATFLLLSASIFIASLVIATLLKRSSAVRSTL
ncbi:MAG: FAD-dependent oxidoreductase [Patescibacteria group bacterium]